MPNEDGGDDSYSIYLSYFWLDMSPSRKSYAADIGVPSFLLYKSSK